MRQKTKSEQKKIDCIDDSKETADAVAERSYYYDDAHGYEDFDPEAPEEDESE